MHEKYSLIHDAQIRRRNHSGGSQSFIEAVFMCYKWALEKRGRVDFIIPFSTMLLGRQI